MAEFTLNTLNSVENVGTVIGNFMHELSEEFKKMNLYIQGDENKVGHSLCKIRSFFDSLAGYREDLQECDLLRKIQFSSF